MTQRDTVLSLLRSGEWTCGNRLADEAGRRASARVFDLRREGLFIESATCRCQRCEAGRKRAQKQGRKPVFVAAYRLVGEGVAAA